MVKRGKRSSKAKKVVVQHSIDRTIAENMVALQKVHTNLIERFDNLAREISQLLSLFETAAKTFAKNSALGEYEKDREFLDKIDKLLDQNKTLAKGLTLMEERLRERMYGVPYTSEHNVEHEVPSVSLAEDSGETREVNAGPSGRPMPHF